MTELVSLLRWPSVEVAADGGETWTILETTLATTDNPIQGPLPEAAR